MNWRVIVRFSLDNDSASVLRNTIASLLNANGISRTTTGTWESAAMPRSQAASCLSGVLTQLATPGTIAGVNPLAHLDHIWIYIDSA